MFIIPSVNNQFIGKINGGHNKKERVYMDANRVSEERDRLSQLREKRFDVGLGDFSSTLFLSLSSVVFTAN